MSDEDFPAHAERKKLIAGMLDDDATQVMAAPEKWEGRDTPAEIAAVPEKPADKASDADKAAADAVVLAELPEGTDYSQFTPESFLAADRAYRRSLAECWPHLIPVEPTGRAVVTGSDGKEEDVLTFADPDAADEQQIHGDTVSLLLNSWHSEARNAVTGTYQTRLDAPEPEPARPVRMRVAGHRPRIHRPEHAEDHGTGPVLRVRDGDTVRLIEPDHFVTAPQHAVRDTA